MRREHLEELGVDEKKILIWNLGQEGVNWTCLTRNRRKWGLVKKTRAHLWIP
jgi:hypothetical protein